MTANNQPTKIVVTKTPGTANINIENRLSLNSENSICSAASNTRGGNNSNKINSLATCGASSGLLGNNRVINTPTRTSPTV